MSSERPPPGDYGRGHSQLPRTIPSRLPPRKNNVSLSPKNQIITQQSHTKRKPIQGTQSTSLNLTKQPLQRRDVSKISAMKKKPLPSNLPTTEVTRQNASPFFKDDHVHQQILALQFSNLREPLPWFQDRQFRRAIAQDPTCCDEKHH